MKTEEFQDIIYEKDDSGVVTLTINQPARKNALSVITLLELWHAAEALETDDTAGAMILTGSEGSFSSGGFFDPKLMKGLDPETAKEIDLTDAAQKKLCLKYLSLSKPVIAAVNGMGIGAGFTLPFACADLTYMSQDAFFHLPFVKLGILPEFACSYLLPRLVGLQRAKEIVYFGEKLTADQALQLGLVNQVLPPDELMDHARKKALALVPPKGAGLAVRQAKQLFNKPLIDAVSQSLDRENQALALAMTSKDFGEAISARMEKRPPVFKGK
jgi:enoyl-CoA hydratase/carnithine racemase